MGASRKLQGEIDRVLKKVQEGVEVFDSIWNKVYDTDNANQKEKFEADLKKEIKKLQRYRDQIKTWIQSSEIKDKKALLESRKVIEREMERFKICEKETKTKAFSKEGLGQQPKTDPKEKAKSETRDWLNNVVSELESQIDYFEADLEGLTVKKGKARPPRLAHLETSIARHKAHIMKLELLLRLLDNDELSPEQVNDVKDFLDDYVERNQDDFDEFSDVDELYSSLPLDKVESLEDLVAVAPPTLVKSAGAVSAVASLKPSVTASPTQVLGALPSVIHQVNSNEDQIEEIASQDGNSDAVPRTPPSKSGALSQSALSTSTGTSTPAASMNNPARPTLSAPVSIRGSLDTSAAVASSPPINVSGSVKEDDNTNFPSRLSSPGLSDIGLGKEVGKESVVGGAINQSSNGAPLSSSSTIPSPGAHGTTSAASDMANRNVFGADERSGSGGIVQPLISPLTSIMAPPQVSGTGSTDSSNIGDASVVSGRVFSASAVPAVQWRPDSASSFQNQSEPGQFRGRTEFAPDQREKFLQRFQQMQQQKQFSTQQQNSPLQQFNSQTQSASLSAQVGMGPGVQGMGMNSHTSASLLQQNSIHHQLTAQHVSVSSGLKDSDGNNVAVEDQQQLQNSSEGSGTDPAMSSGLNKGIMYGDEFKASYAADASVGGSGSLLEVPQTPRDIDLSPRQPLQFNQASSSLGVIGRRSVSDFGAFGDNPSASPVNSGGVQDQLYNLQMLEAAYYKLPQPKDSERAKTYLPRHPVATPSSYPQVQAPIVDNPAFWERLSLDTAGTDALFFAFYYQQNTYQQYLAARELKKQSWRFHRKYNTWFQRHEEPKVTTDEFEQGTYVYFDFHIANDDLQRGWCQRIKTEFTFEYSYLEDELV